MSTGLTTATYRRAADELPHSQAPRWMAWLLGTAVLITCVAIATVLLGPMDERVTAPGVVRPGDYTLVFPAVGGVVAEVPAEPGSTVRRGDLLARFDDADLVHERDVLVQQIAGAEADRADAEARTALAVPPELLLQAAAAPRLAQMVAERRRLLDRMEASGDGRGLSLIELVRERLSFQALELEHERATRVAELVSGPWAEAQRSAARSRVRAAEAALGVLRARLAGVEADLARRTVRAPDDGMLVSRAVRFAGERVEVGHALFKLARSGGNRLRLYAGEDRVDRLRPGQVVLFRPKSDPDRLRRPRTGRITTVALDRDLMHDDGDLPTGTYAVDVDIDPDQPELPLGASVEAEIILGQRSFLYLLLTK
jgi:multidrug resistance efflux pump